MPPWVLKAAVQGTLALVPGGDTLHYWARRFVTRSMRVSLDDFRGGLRIAARHVRNYRSANASDGRFEPATTLEIGTGSQPIVPIALRLCGASKVVSIDIASHLHPDLTREVLGAFISWREELDELLPSVDEDVIALLETARLKRDAKEMLATLGIDTIVGDAARLGHPARSIDFVISNHALEHIPASVLRTILSELHRVVAPAGIVSHYVNTSDHYEGFDHSITAYNYFRFSTAQWKWFNNSLQYQNRLRPSDYRRMHMESGFKILESQESPGSLEELARVRLAAEFRAYAPDDLAARNLWIVAGLATDR